MPGRVFPVPGSLDWPDLNRVDHRTYISPRTRPDVLKVEYERIDVCERAVRRRLSAGAVKRNDRQTCFRIGRVADVLLVFSAANAMLGREKLDELDAGLLRTVAHEEVDIRMSFLVDARLIGEKRDALSPDQLHAV